MLRAFWNRNISEGLQEFMNSMKARMDLQKLSQ